MVVMKLELIHYISGIKAAKAGNKRYCYEEELKSKDQGEQEQDSFMTNEY